MGAYYNEWDAFAAQWLRNLIKRGLLSDGEVDERSIGDVRPDDLRGFSQCHFFAGIGGWPFALRLAGWEDSREVWSGSCPCQPLSVAGKQKGADDKRHLWPAFHSIIAKCKPSVIVGEQVSGASGHEWFAGVRADLEESGYACGCVDTPACAVGAPHIRQRLYWCAVENAHNHRVGGFSGTASNSGREAVGAGANSIRREDGTRMPSRADARNSSDLEHPARVGRREGRAEHEFRSWREPAPGAGSGVVADAHKSRLEGWKLPIERADKQPFGQDRMADASGGGRGWRAEDSQRVAERGNAAEWVGGDMGDADGQGGGRFADAPLGGQDGRAFTDRLSEKSFWSDYAWRTGADGKSRRVGLAKPGLCGVADGLSAGMDRMRAGTIPLLAQGVKGRVGKLRGYGNAIVPQLAAEFVMAVMEAMP